MDGSQSSQSGGTLSSQTHIQGSGFTSLLMHYEEPKLITVSNMGQTGDYDANILCYVHIMSKTGVRGAIIKQSPHVRRSSVNWPNMESDP